MMNLEKIVVKDKYWKDKIIREEELVVLVSNICHLDLNLIPMIILMLMKLRLCHDQILLNIIPKMK